MRAGAIPSTWFGLFPSKGWDADFMLSVAAECVQLKIPFDDLDAVRNVGNRLSAGASLAVLIEKAKEF